MTVQASALPYHAALPEWMIATLPLPNGWQVSLPDHWQPLAEALHAPSWQHWLETSQSMTADFLVARTVATVPVWLLVKPLQRRICLYSLQARQEIAWRDALSALGNWSEDLPLARHLQLLEALDTTAMPSVWEQTTRQHHLPPVNEDPALDEAINAVFLQLKPLLSAYHPSWMEKASNWSLDLMTRHPALRDQMLRYIAMLPNLDWDKSGELVKASSLEVIETLQRLQKQESHALPSWLNGWLQTSAPLVKAMPPSLLYRVVRAKVRQLAKRFIVGETLPEAMPAIDRLHASQRQVTLDPLGEIVLSDHEATAYEKRVLSLIEQLGQQLGQAPANGAGLPLAHLSLKVSALGANLRPWAVESAKESVIPRLRRILLAAQQHGVFVNIDAEHYVLRDLVFDLWKETLLSTPELAQWSNTGIVVQAYLRDAAPHLQAIQELARQRGQRCCVRLVKGAYWDQETLEAEAQGHPAPQFLNKEETDLHFRQLVEVILQAGEHLQLAIGSHNVADHCHAEALRQQRYPQAPMIEHQCLHQTYEALSLAMAQIGWVVRDYVPVGNLLVGMAYLVRRILENASQVGVLTQARHQVDVLPESPRVRYQRLLQEHRLHAQPVDWLREGAFANTPPVRLELPQERAEIATAYQRLTMVEGSDKDAHRHGARHTSYNPSYPDRVVGSITLASAEDVPLTVEILHRSQTTGGWSQWPVAQRALILMKAADLLLLHRPQVAALITAEGGKPIAEALGDVDEAIDFLNFYSREAMNLATRHPNLTSRGVTAVIAPWNFPLAIPCGMVAGALATGNPVILKSAEQTPLIAEALVSVLHEAGVPPSALVHLPGEGETVGQALASHPNVSTVVFTGSRSVGLTLLKTAGARRYTHPVHQQSLPVQVVAEMGGKNAIVVTADADLDEAVAGIVASVCGHAGQKCSAASRVLVDERIAKALAKRLGRALSQWRVGPADQWETQIGPVIGAPDRDRLLNLAQRARQEADQFGGNVWQDAVSVEGAGYFVGPMLVELPVRRALFHESLAQHELFGPMVHLIPFQSLEEAVQVANSTPYALTAGVYSQSPATTRWLLERLAAGNLYANRSITGARVAVEPFGGYRHSGTGPKAGDAEYLKAFVVAPSGEYPRQVQTTTSLTDMREGVADLKPVSPSTHPLPLRTATHRKAVLQAMDNWISLHQDDAAQMVTLTRLRLWMQGEGEQLLVHGRDNRSLPGQQSVNRYTRPVGPILLVAEHAQPSAWLSPHLWMAWWLGCPVTVVPVSQQAQRAWRDDLSVLGGLAPQDVLTGLQTLVPMPLAQVKDVIAIGRWPVVLVDGPADTAAYCQQWVAEGQGKRRNLTQLLSVAQPGIAGDWNGLLHRYSYPVSWSVNQMRHGALLTLPTT